MANIVYPAYRHAAYTGASNVSLTGGTLKCVFVDAADYTYSSAHDFYNDVAAGARVGTPQTIGSVTLSATTAILDGADVTFTAVSGDPCEYLLLYLDTGNEATSRLVALIDTATGLTLTPNGGNVGVTFHASGIIQF
jgi:hypothetical protein